MAVCQMHEKDLRHWSFEDVIVLHAFLLFCHHCYCCISFFFELLTCDLIRLFFWQTLVHCIHAFMKMCISSNCFVMVNCLVENLQNTGTSAICYSNFCFITCILWCVCQFDWSEIFPLLLFFFFFPSCKRNHQIFTLFFYIYIFY